MSHTGTSPVAVLVFHGIGQQAPFETLNDVSEALVRSQAVDGWARVAESVEMRPIAGSADSLIPVAIIKLHRCGDSNVQEEREFHVYEAYWARATEGLVRLYDVLLFLLKAGCDGVRSALAGSFTRWVFQAPQCFEVPWSTLVYLTTALAILLASLVLALSFIAVAGFDFLSHFGVPVKSGVMSAAAAVRMHLIDAVWMSLLAVSLPIAFGKLQKKAIGRAPSWINFLAVSGVLPALLIPAVGSLLAWKYVAGCCSFSVYETSRTASVISEYVPAMVRGVVFFGGGTALLLYARWFLIKYVGDITAYVSAHAVNRFWRVREDIARRALQICRTVYSLKAPQGMSAYQKVVIVGHSLGSVIAYDVLNQLISLELCEDPPISQVSQRTRLITCGSPLNKTAFLFRYSSGGALSPWRERASNRLQPLIVAHKHRPVKWINIWSYPDWISGRLTFYERPSAVPSSNLAGVLPEANMIDNREDREAFVPMYEHSTYFCRAVTRRALNDAVQ